MKFRHHLLLTLLPLAGLALGGCANVALIVHEDSIRVAVETKADATEPINIQAAYRQRHAIIVPPRKGLSGAKLFSGKNVASGDALSTITKFQAARVRAGVDLDPRVGLHIQTGIYSGRAANAHATGLVPPASAEEQAVGLDATTDGSTNGRKQFRQGLNDQVQRIMQPVDKPPLRSAAP